MPDQCCICDRRRVPVIHWGSQYICEECLLLYVGHGADPNQVLGNRMSVSWLVARVAKTAREYERKRVRRAECRRVRKDKAKWLNGH